MKKHRRYFFLCYLLILFSGSRAFFLFGQNDLKFRISEKIHFRGFIKNMQSTSFISSPQSLITGNYIHNRINFKWDINTNWNLRFESRNRLYYGEQVKSTYQFGKYIEADNGYFCLSHNIIDDSGIVLNTSIDRASLSWTKNNIEVTVGRQRLNWGINLVWNPNDIFNTFNYFDFDYEERPGSDAIRVQYNKGIFSSLQGVYKPAQEYNQQVGAVMYKTNFKKYDWQTFIGVYQEDLVSGTGWAGNINQLGFKGEITYFHSFSMSVKMKEILIGSISLDKTFKKNYFMMFSYLYNGSAKEILNNASDFSKINLSAKNLMPFTHTFFAQLTKTFNPLVSAGLSCMYSLSKNTLILFPTLTVSLSENCDVALIAQSFFSETVKRYESLGSSIFLRLRWSF